MRPDLAFGDEMIAGACNQTRGGNEQRVDPTEPRGDLPHEQQADDRAAAQDQPFVRQVKKLQIETPCPAVSPALDGIRYHSQSRREANRAPWSASIGSARRWATLGGGCDESSLAPRPASV